MLSCGIPEMYVDFSLGFFEASRKGQLATIEPTFERLIGHSPSRLITFISILTLSVCVGNN